METHISLVFVGSDTVWKLKKAVRLAFLDFTPLEARRRFTLRELELNRPAAPGLYRDVVPVVRRADGSLALAMRASGQVVDWVLRMARVPPDDFLDAIADDGQADAGIARCAGRRGGGVSTAALPPAYRDGCRRGDAPCHRRQRAFRRSTPACREPRCKPGRRASWPRWTRIAPWLAQRERDGFVRRAHGDLHLGNLCLWQGRPVPFDALEFDEAMATIDLGYDLAFLLMDLDQRVDAGGGQPCAEPLRRAHRRRRADARAAAVPVAARDGARACRGEARQCGSWPRAIWQRPPAYLQPTPAVVVAIGGLPGTGKSTLARALAPELGNAPGALVLRSDEIRKRQHGVAPEQRLPQSAYSDAASEAVFAESGRAVRDTACRRPCRDRRRHLHRHASSATRGRAAARQPACASSALWLEAPLAVLEARVSARAGRRVGRRLSRCCARARQADPGAGDWIADRCQRHAATPLSHSRARRSHRT